MWAALCDRGVKLAMETVRKLIRSIGLKTELYHTASYSPDMELVLGMLDELETKLPAYSHPVIHSDQGSQYQSPTYQARLEEMELVQSMSRKGNCHDNAPGETIFNLMKRERLNRVKLHSLEEVQQELEDYIYWFNNIRRSNKLNYTTPVKYRDRVMATI